MRKKILKTVFYLETAAVLWNVSYKVGLVIGKHTRKLRNH